MRKEETSPDDQKHRRPEQRSHELKIRGNPSSDDFLVGGEHWEQRIERHAGPHPRRKERDRIQDRCDEEQNAQEVLHQLGDVAHEHGEGCEQQRQPQVERRVEGEQQRKERDSRPDRPTERDVDDEVHSPGRHELEQTLVHRADGEQCTREGGVQQQSTTTDHRSRALVQGRAGELEQEDAANEQRQLVAGTAAALAAAKHLDQEEVDRGCEQRIEHGPELTGHRARPLALDLGTGLGLDEPPAVPQLLQVRLERRKLDRVRLEDVLDCRRVIRSGRAQLGGAHLVLPVSGSGSMSRSARSAARTMRAFSSRIVSRRRLSVRPLGDVSGCTRLSKRGTRLALRNSRLSGPKRPETSLVSSSSAAAMSGGMNSVPARFESARNESKPLVGSFAFPKNSVTACWSQPWGGSSWDLRAASRSTVAMTSSTCSSGTGTMT